MKRHSSANSIHVRKTYVLSFHAFINSLTLLSTLSLWTVETLWPSYAVENCALPAPGDGGLRWGGGRGAPDSCGASQLAQCQGWGTMVCYKPQPADVWVNGSKCVLEGWKVVNSVLQVGWLTTWHVGGWIRVLERGERILSCALC